MPLPGCYLLLGFLLPALCLLGCLNLPFCVRPPASSWIKEFAFCHAPGPRITSLHSLLLQGQQINIQRVFYIMYNNSRQCFSSISRRGNSTSTASFKQLQLTENPPSGILTGRRVLDTASSDDHQPRSLQLSSFPCLVCNKFSRLLRQR